VNYTLTQASRLGARRTNQDRIGQWASREALLLAVADGMGGHLHGEIAAEVAVEVLGRAFAVEAKPRVAQPAEFLARTVAAAHEAILREAESRELSEAPRTTVVACLVQGGFAYWAHVGDSRLYLFRSARIHARTRDHTLVQQLVDAGRIREEAVSSHPERNRILQCLGGMQPPRIDTGSERLAKDDIVLLCSDGLWGPLTQRHMLTALLGRGLEDAVAGLVDLAEMRAGAECDNTSVIAMSWGQDAVRLPEDEPRTVPYNELATDVRDFTATELDYLRMSDEDVEKAIDEIKAALRKNNAPRPQ
jgi:serine/threonine protein phosphatase PrpC